MLMQSLGRMTVLAAASMLVQAAEAPRPAMPEAVSAAFWKTVAASGDVAMQPPTSPATQWIQLRRGDQVAPLSHVRTQARGNATLTRDGDVILVAPGSDVVMPERTPAGTTRVEQRSGKAFYQVSPRSSGRFEVQTPMLVAGVKGTEFSVVIEDGRAAVSVVEGHVEVLSLLTGEKQDLFAGMSTVVDARERTMEMHRETPGRGGRRGRGESADPPAILKETARLNDEAGELSEDLVKETVTETTETTSVVSAELDRSLWDDLSDSACVKDGGREGTSGTSDTTTLTSDPIGTVGDVVGGVTDPLTSKSTSPLSPTVTLLNGVLRRP